MSNKISCAGPNTVSEELQKVIQQRKEETQSRIKLTHVIYIYTRNDQTVLNLACLIIVLNNYIFFIYTSL